MEVSGIYDNNIKANLGKGVGVACSAQDGFVAGTVGSGICSLYKVNLK